MTAGIGKRRLSWRDLPTLERAHKRQRKVRPLASDVVNPFAPKAKPKRPKRGAIDYWRVTKGRGGRLAVVDRDGVDVMEHASALRRLENAHLIAAAPELRDALDMIAHRMQSYLATHCMTYSRDAEMCTYVMQVLASVAPRWEEVQRATETATPRRQLHKLRSQGVA